MRDPYEVLGVAKTATPDDVKKAYRRLAMRYHPDRNSAPDAKDRFAEIQNAYDRISNPEKFAQQQGGFGGGFGGGFEVDPNEINDLFSSMFGDIFGGARARGRSAPKPIQVELAVDLADVALGRSVQIDFGAPKTCGTCSGTRGDRATCDACGGRGVRASQLGNMMFQRTCETCGGGGERVVKPCAACAGRGQINEPVSLNVTMPVGIEDGSTIRLNGAAHGRDVFVHVRIQDHPVFSMQHGELIGRVGVRSTLAIMGGSITLSGIDGQPITVTIPKGTQPGDVLMVPGQGAVTKKKTRGQLRLVVNLETPVNLTREQIELMRQIEATWTKDNQPKNGSWWEQVKNYF